MELNCSFSYLYFLDMGPEQWHTSSEACHSHMELQVSHLQMHVNPAKQQDGKSFLTGGTAKLSAAIKEFKDMEKSW